MASRRSTDNSSSSSTNPRRDDDDEADLLSTSGQRSTHMQGGAAGGGGGRQLTSGVGERRHDQDHYGRGDAEDSQQENGGKSVFKGRAKSMASFLNSKDHDYGGDIRGRDDIYGAKSAPSSERKVKPEKKPKLAVADIDGKSENIEAHREMYWMGPALKSDKNRMYYGKAMVKGCQFTVGDTVIYIYIYIYICRYKCVITCIIYVYM